MAYFSWERYRDQLARQGDGQLIPMGLWRSHVVLPLLCILLICACAPVEMTEHQDPAEITAQAMDSFNRGRYFAALRDFKQVQDQFPFTKYSLLAELKSADSHYYMKEYSEAIALYEDFESKHPTNEAMPYVLFQIGMCRFKGIDTIDRDPGAAHDAIGIFTRLIRTYPQSSYVVEAKIRVKEAREFLAAHELYVARFYMWTNAMDAAASRLETLLVQYPDAEVAAEAQTMLEEVESLRKENGGSGRYPLLKRIFSFF